MSKTCFSVPFTLMLKIQGDSFQRARELGGLKLEIKLEW